METVRRLDCLNDAENSVLSGQRLKRHKVFIGRRPEMVRKRNGVYPAKARILHGQDKMFYFLLP